MSDISLVAAWVAKAMEGTIVAGSPALEFGGVSIDTRTLAPGDLYVAIRGERFDGVDFVPAALAAGAAGVVLPRGKGPAALDAGVVVEVDDTIAGLQRLAHTVRRASGARVVAITGSAGKTTTKEVTAAFLGTRYRVIRNRGNLNNHIGLPLSLIELRTRPEIAVVELGMNHVGEISALMRIAEPEVRVWTNVGEAHLGFFASLDQIADAKAEILEGATPETVLVANADDDRVMARSAAFSGRVMTFGVDRRAAVHATSIVDQGVNGIGASVSTPHGTFELSMPLLGRGNLANVLAATAVALELGVPVDAIATRARTLEPSPHRGQVVRLPSGVTVIDDSYNANPTAMRQALDILDGALRSTTSGDEGRSEPLPGRRIAVLGEMLELGQQAVALHELVGRSAAGRADLLVAIGGDPAARLARAAVAAGMASASVQYCENSQAAADVVASLVRAGDVVLVKGSRGIETDRVVERLKAERA